LYSLNARCFAPGEPGKRTGLSQASAQRCIAYKKVRDFAAAEILKYAFPFGKSRTEILPILLAPSLELLTREPQNPWVSAQRRGYESVVLRVLVIDRSVRKLNRHEVTLPDPGLREKSFSSTTRDCSFRNQF
jgi:hypothetical protein